MVSSVVRTLTFFNKWLADIVREPTLLASLVLGPFLILLLFGVGAKVGGAPKPSAIIVEAEGQRAENGLAPEAQDVSQYLTIVGRTSDAQQATRALARREVDLVVVLPPAPEQVIANGRRAEVSIFTNEIDPLRDSYAQAYLYYQISTLNQVTLQRAIESAQGQAGQVRELVTQARARLQGVRAAQQDAVAAQRELRQLKTTLDPLAEALDSVVAIGGSGVSRVLPGGAEALERAQAAGRSVDEMQRRIDEFDARLGAGGAGPSVQELDQWERLLTELDQAAARFTSIPAEVLSAPFELKLTNVAPFQLSTIGFYAPAVLALLLQHLAVTLGALSMARVRLLGLMELLQASPVRPIEVTVGNYLAYGSLCVIAGGVLVALLVGVLGVPIFGSLTAFAAITLLLIACSLGVGFVIAMVSQSEQQAAQLAMLVLIASVFFSGFMIFLESIEWPVRIVSYLLPATYAIQSLRDVMLRGALLAPIDLYVLGGASLVLFIMTTMLYRRELQPK